MTLTGLLPVSLQRAWWDVKYLTGYGRGALPKTAAFIAEWAGNRSILDLGCGAGSFSRCLHAAGFRGNYTGVDLSPQAIETAKLLDSGNCQWLVSDFANFRSRERFHAVCLIEAIYYLDVATARELVERIRATMLHDGGRLYIRIHDYRKHADHAEMLTATFPNAVRGPDGLLYVER